MANVKDLTGMKFNRLTVISENGRSSGGAVLWKCKCDCGNETIVIAYNLKNGNTKSCGCVKIIDLVGQKFGRLTVISDTGEKSQRCVAWLCVCDCGNKINVRSTSLINGHTSSCGCLQIDHAIALGKNKFTHGLVDTSEYGIWAAMKARCLNSNNPAYNNYGERGIAVCDRWLNSFENFYADMGPRPSLEHSIDRYPNNDGNYEHGNCRWATREEQANNRRSNHIVSYNGTEFTIAQLAREYNISYNVLNGRIQTGWSIENALNTPAK